MISLYLAAGESRRECLFVSKPYKAADGKTYTAISRLRFYCDGRRPEWSSSEYVAYVTDRKQALRMAREQGDRDGLPVLDAAAPLTYQPSDDELTALFA